MQDAEKYRLLGHAVVEQEAAAVRTLAERIDERFAQACQILLSCTGCTIVMGIGKSGHIAQKIAATFSSLHHPSFFVHPAEAKHGDSGMITRKDVVIMLSKSGETEELLCIIPVVKHLGIPLISITGNPQSTLAKAAQINLDISIEKEACPLGLAPTTSTTVTLAMGYALAVVVAQQKSMGESLLQKNELVASQY